MYFFNVHYAVLSHYTESVTLSRLNIKTQYMCIFPCVRVMNNSESIKWNEPITF